MKKCPQRIITSKSLWEKLTVGELSELIGYVSQRENGLDLQIRDNYINIYYKGGNILKLGPNSYVLDEFYFYNNKNIRKTHLLVKAKNGDKTANDVIVGLRKKRDDLVDILRSGHDYVRYFEQGKELIDSWLNYLRELGIRHQEKEDQQMISLNNRHNASDYTVLDLEYMVSSLSDFHYNGNLDKSKPRFDIIAIENATGKLVVIELKSGGGAIHSTSGIKEHIDCFNNTIGRDSKQSFLNEMRNLCKQKQGLGLIDEELVLSQKAPEFVFAFSPKSGDSYNIYNFKRDCMNINFGGRILLLDNDKKLFNIQK